MAGHDDLYYAGIRTKISLCGRLPGIAEHGIDQRGVGIFLHLPDLSVGQAKHKAVFVVVWRSRLGEVVAPRFDDHVIVLGDESMRDGPRSPRKLCSDSA